MTQEQIDLMSDEEFEEYLERLEDALDMPEIGDGEYNCWGRGIDGDLDETLGKPL